jgi:lipid II:glycine glycyltransferase (peptidoglycan interpeptide bridge formation enzyme)
MELRVLESPGQEWDEFVSRYTDLIFYQSLWGEVLRQGLGGTPLYYILKEGDEIVAGLPSVLLKVKLFKVLYASIPYGNFVGETTTFPEMTERLEREHRKKGIDQVRITESPFAEPYVPRSFTAIPTACSVLDLEGLNPETARDRYPGEVRRAIRKAEKSGLAIKKASRREEVDIFYRLYLSAMERNRTTGKYPARWFHAVYEKLVQTGQADIVFAVKGDLYAAGVLLVRSSTSNHYLHNGSDPDRLGDRPNDLIVNHLIVDALREGKKALDFMGSDLKDRALIRFKEKWGSRSVVTHTYTKDYHPLRCKAWEAGKRWAGSRWGRRVLTWLGSGS